MADSIKIRLDTSKYAVPTQEDIAEGKRYVLRREQAATMLQEEIDSILADTAEKVTTICYQYGVDPKTFKISSEYNEDMMREIADVMDEAEQKILDLINTFAIPEETSDSNKTALFLWMAMLGKGNRNLHQTLEGYMNKMLADWEAAIAALVSAKAPLSKATTRIKTYLHSIYTMPEVVEAFKRYTEFAATYIRSRGVQYGAVGISNNGSTNVVNMGKYTLQMAWMRAQALAYEENGAVGYYQLRGSNYLCDVCDSEVGFHPDIEEVFTKAYPHPNCMCFRIPIFTKEQKEFMDSLV